VKRALMLSRSYGGFHPEDYAFEVISGELTRRGIATVERACDTDCFLSLDGYDLLLIYTDRGELSDEEEQALLGWVEAGGGLVGIHGAAASFDSSEKYHALLGAQFVSHPPKTKFTVWRRDVEHMATVRMPASMTVNDELYMLEQKADFHALASAKYLGKDLPITYVRSQGDGRVFYTGFGHDRDSLDDPFVRDQIAYGARWALGQEPKPDVRVGLVGYGPAFGMGRLHATLVSDTPGMQLVAVCDRDGERLKAAAEDWPGIRTYADSAGLAADPGVDLVVVILPHNLHYPVADQMLDAGKHVLVEKPFTIEGRQAANLIEKARLHKLTVTVFHNRRWDRDFLAVREVINSGEIGVPYLYEACLSSFGHPGYWWRSDKAISGGSMYDWGAHGVDWGLNVIDDDVDYVIAWAQKRRWFDVSNEDAAKLVAHFKGGQLMDIEFGNLAASRKTFMRILGTKGAIEVRPANRDLGSRILVMRENEDGLVEELVPYSARPSFGEHRWQEWSAVDDMYRRLADHFILGDPVPVTPESAARVIGVIEAARISAEAGKPEAPTYW